MSSIPPKGIERSADQVGAIALDKINLENYIMEFNKYGKKQQKF